MGKTFWTRRMQRQRLRASYSMETVIFRWSLEPVGAEEREAGEGELGMHCCRLYSLLFPKPQQQCWPCRKLNNCLTKRK